jgi:putative hydrolase of the HAD superfamily
MTRLPDRAVVFDLDDTLHRLRRFTLGGYLATAISIERETGRPARDTFRFLFGLYRRGQGAQAYQDLCESLGLSVEHAADFLRVHRAHQPRLRLTPDARVVLRQMRATWRIGILTNGIPSLQRHKVAALGVEDQADALVYADEIVAGGKPALEAFAAVCERLRVEPERSVMVGDDGGADIAGGRAAGLRTIWIRRHRSVIPPAGTADAVLDSLAAVPLVAARLLGEER